MKKKAILYILVVMVLTVNISMAAAQEQVYRLGPGDVLEISVWKDEELSRQIIVPPDGIMSFPLIGDIDVRELSVPELRDIVSKKLSEYVTGAEVTVMLLSANSLRAYVVGKVNSPGQFPITMQTNVMQLIAMAGDLNTFASSGSILILRREKDVTQSFPFDYDEVKKGKELEQNIILRRGDIVVVP